MPEVRDEEDEATAAIFQQGTDVGMLARQLFPGGVDATPPSAFEYQKAVFNTAKYIAEGHKVIYEAAFQFEGVLCAVDILVKKNKKWYAYEVKGSTKVKDVFVQDAALQYYVITSSGLELEDICLIHLNSSYIRQGELDIECLFSKPSIKHEMPAQQPKVRLKIEELKKVIQGKVMPQVAVGAQCSKPYPCDFTGYCHKDIECPKPDYGKKYIDKPALKAFVAGLSYPLYFLDFESYITAVPAYDGHWSYRQIVFQYSLHIVDAHRAKPRHYSYLANDPGTPMEHLVKQLVKDIGPKGSVIVYNKTFENGRLNELKGQYPINAKKIESIQSRIVDLMVPFQKKYYYTPEMLGRYSIKTVLPALVPELSYDDLEIGNGGDASSAFYKLKDETNTAVIQTTREQLLRYCEMDTWAMVKILEKIKRIL